MNTEDGHEPTDRVPRAQGVQVRGLSATASTSKTFWGEPQSAPNERPFLKPGTEAVAAAQAHH